ncbi:tyrosine-protein phosphatase [Dyadobacter sp. CY326]|uniref:tyrosine-protein phosphatase n=1 Tax=Dyadobacter sp. CY326 TaxID=2907300 RepID=UPI001F30AF79|nr:CpsB/CapC family capsule biosynthesis tyrosine phosphatase [Dyadobacter sp. CY326]MCE7066563.1 histidinol phosphatase [Dyadobacter sp. CY326]
MLDWIFKNKNKKQINLAHIGIDIHSHILPGIDDGVETIEESVAMAAKMQDLGYTHAVTTPHIIWDCYKNTPEIISSKLDEVKKAVLAAGLDIAIGAAAEYFIDEHFMQMLINRETLLTLPGNRLLVELPYSTPLLNLAETLFSIIEFGYQPVLAHPERYTYFHSDLPMYRKLSDQGCELQVNILSLTGYYGDNITKIAEWLLRNDLITFIGTDAHKIQHLNMIQQSDRHKWVSTYPFQNEKLVGLW